MRTRCANPASPILGAVFFLFFFTTDPLALRAGPRSLALQQKPRGCPVWGIYPREEGPLAITTLAYPLDSSC